VTVADWIIVAVMAGAVIGGFVQGFLRSIFSLGGLVLGLLLAAWNYGRLAALLKPLAHHEEVADAIAFLLIAILVMVAAGVVGSLLSKVVHKIGLGCLDRLAGTVFGLFQGALLVTVCILVTLAFFPKAEWLGQSRLPKYFYGACHLSAQVSPSQLADRVRLELKTLEKASPVWMHPDKSGV
jgi:membrane protein required for colicin V production